VFIKEICSFTYKFYVSSKTPFKILWKKNQFNIQINATVNKVYDMMLGLSNIKTYEQWTSIFNPTSTYEGNWNKGSKILFVGMNDKAEKEAWYRKLKKTFPINLFQLNT
jgi:hypothetical protein